MRLTNLSFWIIISALFLACEGDYASDASETGQGGSMTRFAINGNYLYVVERSSIAVFDIEGNEFNKLNEVESFPGLETIFARGEYLYLGSVDAMHIYSIADRENPSLLFSYSHIISCDPVVVQGDRAYVTLRTGSGCNNAGMSALEIIDITNKEAPQLITNYRLTSPYGLGVKGDLVFICEGENGLAVLDISNELAPVEINRINDLYAYDVIVRQDELIITGEDGVFQYSCNDDGTQLDLVSKITVDRTEL